jgi:hypothetical protein
MESMLRLQAIAPFVCIFTLSALAVQKPNAKDQLPTAVINLIVLKESNGKPVKNAEVVLHLVDEHGRQKQEGLELKTHDDGKAGTSGIAYGKIRVQVIAHGFRTFGQDYDVNQPNLDITIKLEKPTDQVSIYK